MKGMAILFIISVANTKVKKDYNFILQSMDNDNIYINSQIVMIIIIIKMPKE